jgi:cell division protein FtsN
VNKPKGAIIKDQPKAETLPAVQKPTEVQSVPKTEKATEAKIVPVPEQKTTVTKAAEPEKTKEIVPAATIPAKTDATEPVKETGKAIKKTKDGKVVVPPIDQISKAEPTKFFIQAGAFDSKVHAERLASDLLQLTLKRWFIVYDDGLYKVRLGYFTSKEAAKRVEETLNTTEVPYYVDGISDVARPIELKDIPKGKGQKQNNENNQRELKEKKNNEKTPANQQEPQGKTIDNEKTKAGKRNGFVETPMNDKYDKGLDEHKFYIQADAFTNRAAAEQLVTELYITTRKEWFIVAEDGLFKVRLGYFGSKDEAKYVEGTLNTPGTYYYIDELPAE